MREFDTNTNIKIHIERELGLDALRCLVVEYHNEFKFSCDQGWQSGQVGSKKSKPKFDLFIKQVKF